MVTSKPFFMKSIIVLCLYLVVFGFTINTNAQDSILVHFDNKYFLPKDKIYSHMKLLNLNNGDSIHYDNKSYKLILPEKFFVKDTAVAFNSFTGWKNPAIKNATLFTPFSTGLSGIQFSKLKVLKFMTSKYQKVLQH